MEKKIKKKPEDDTNSQDVDGYESEEEFEEKSLKNQTRFVTIL